MRKYFFCGQIITPIIIEKQDLLYMRMYVKNVYFLLKEKKITIKFLDDILYDDYNLDLKFIYEDYITEDIHGDQGWKSL